MIEGGLRHCTEMSINKQYVDSHGQSEVGFAFCRLLSFQLLPRLKGIHCQKLYIPEAGTAERYPHLRLILSRPIQWVIADAGHESRKLARELWREDNWKLQIVKRRQRAFKIRRAYLDCGAHLRMART
jgi:TnpA family transposase